MSHLHPGKMTFLLSRRAMLVGSLLSLGGITPVPGWGQKIVPKTTLGIFSEQPESHVLKQETFVTRGKRRYRIFTAVPTSEPPPSGFSILYMLDGNAAFDDMNTKLLQTASNLIIVGIGYETELRVDSVQRALDYTPPGSYDERFGASRVLGGADHFLRSVVTEICPEVETGLPVDKTRRFLWGHSYGGLFVLSALFHRHDFFHGFISISPSTGLVVGWLDDQIRDARWPQDGKIPVFIALGDDEHRRNGPKAAIGNPDPVTMTLIEQLRADPRLSADALVLKGHSHAQTFTASIPMAFDWIKGNSSFSP